MNVRSFPTPPKSDEPAVRTPELSRLVALARSQPPPSLSLDAEGLHDAWHERRGTRRRRVVLALVATVVAAVGITALERRQPTSDGIVGAPLAQADRPAVVLDHPQTPALAKPTLDTAAPTPRTVQEASDRSSEPGDGDGEPVTLATAVSIAPKEPGTGEIAIVSAWEVQVAGGVYNVAVSLEAEHSLTVQLGARTLAVDPGSSVEVDGSSARARLAEGAAGWLEADGTRRELKATEARHRIVKPSPSKLVREAETQMIAGDKTAAIRTLERLVKLYPRSSSTRAATLDLARLLKSTGRRDRARCAYTLYLKRWPSTPLRAEVERALSGLGSGECRGLRPR